MNGQPCFLRMWALRLHGVITCGAALAAPLSCAEDADRRRAYLHFRSGEFNTAWDVHDYWGLSLGMNFNRCWGAEIAGDVFELYTAYGEESVNSFMPQVRFRYPLLNDRLVPYAILGAGPVFIQYNDPRGYGVGSEVDADGWRAGLAAGIGLEYFLADNVTFAAEGKYLWVDPLDIDVAGQRQQFDASTFLASIGLRVYFDENRPRALAESEAEVPARFYFSVRYGGSVLTDSHLDSRLTLEPESSAAWETLNPYGTLLLGANFGENWGAEITLGNGEQRLIHQDLGTLGEYAVFYAIPQVRLRAPLAGGRWVPYVSAGVGAAYAEFNDPRGPYGVDAKGVYPAVSVGAGVEYFITRNFSLNADLGWNYTWGHEIKVGSEQFSGDFSSFQIQIGFRVYLFEGR